jgi:hypothetical protein
MPNVFNIYEHNFIALGIYKFMNLPVNLKNLLTKILKPVNYGKNSVVDNIGPRERDYTL